jgi:hypothetical protein
MNDEITMAVKVLAVLGGISLLAWIGIVAVKGARHGGGGIRGIGGAMLMLFSWAHLRDPADNPVAEARDGRIRKGTHSGDPLDRDPPGID